MHMLDTTQTVYEGHQLLYKITQSITAKIYNEDCAGLDKELALQHKQGKRKRLNHGDLVPPLPLMPVTPQPSPSFSTTSLPSVHMSLQSPPFSCPLALPKVSRSFPSSGSSLIVKNACLASSTGSTGALEWSGVLTERTWLQLMCCALSDGGPSISELSGVESRRSSDGVRNWIKGSRIRGGGGSE
jgi:hypothetical protein